MRKKYGPAPRYGARRAFSVRMEPVLHEQLQELSATTGRPMGELAVEAIMDLIRRHAEAEKMPLAS